jgi:hypothetical protein
MSHVVDCVQLTPAAHALLPHVTVHGMPAGHATAPAHELAVVQSIPHVPFEHVPASQREAQRACASTIIIEPSDGASPAASPESPAPPSPLGPVSLPLSATSLVAGASADASSPVDPSGPGGSATGLLLPHACAKAAPPAAMEMTAATAAKLRTRDPMRDGYTAA